MRAALERIGAEVRPESALAAGLALAALSLLALALYGVRPELARYRELRGQRAAILSGTSAEAREQALASAEGETLELRHALYGRDHAVPAREVESNVIGLLDRISTEHAVDLQSVEPGEPRQELGFEELPYEVRAAGDYFSLFAWLRAVERDLRPLTVKQFEMGRERESGRIGISLRLAAYRVPETRR